MQTSIQTQGRRVLISSRRQARWLNALRQAVRGARASIAALAFWAPALQQV